MTHTVFTLHCFITERHFFNDPEFILVQSQFNKLLNYSEKVKFSSAALSAYYDGISSLNDESFWLRADPVHLQTDWQNIFMLGNKDFSYNSEQIETLRILLNDYLKNEKIELFIPDSKRWYLKLNQPLSMIGQDPNEILGKSIIDFLPRGEEQKYWRKLFNEIQMLLHQASAPIDALWFWGGGTLPKKAASTTQMNFYTNDCSLAGLAQLNQISSRYSRNFVEIKSSLREQMGCGDVIFCWINSENQVLLPELQKIAKLKKYQLKLYSQEEYCYSLQSPSLWKKILATCFRQRRRKRAKSHCEKKF